MRINKTHFFFFAFPLLLACSSPQRKISSGESAPDYDTVFQKTRDVLLTKVEGKNSLTPELKKIPEHEVVHQLVTRQELLTETRENLIQALKERQSFVSKSFTRLLPPPGQPGYSELKIYVNHPYYDGETLVPPTDLVETWRQFILSAKKEIVLNVFDFDLEVVADALIEKAEQGLSVKVGVDQKSVVNVRPEVAAIVAKLQARGVQVTGVNPVGLNHQKMTALDWSNPDEARVLFSSGNLTRSCLEPEGDLKGTVPLPKESVPNANHFITMKSWILANIVQHELTKTLDSRYLLRGSEYPMNGAYQITGPGINPETLEAYPEPSVIISFSPGGGLRKIGLNLIADVIKRETGSIRMLQFAYSSADVDEALRFRAEKDLQETGKFDFMSVGDTPFAMREWSGFLKMSGYRLEISEDKLSKRYVPDTEGAWMKSLSESQMKDLRSRVYVAPKVYGNNWALVAGKRVKVNAKIHHKVLATPKYAILGTSFNFSAGAESNNEQILIFRDSSLSRVVDGMVKWMVENSPGSVEQEAQKRNARGGFNDDEDEDVESKTL